MKVRNLLPYAVALCCVSAYAGTSALDDSVLGEEKPLQAPAYGGLVANQTMTVAGYEFYRYFVAAWRDKEGSDRYTLSVHEQPSARFGSRIWIELSHRRIFQTNLPSTRSSLQPLGEYAAELAYNTAMEAEVEHALFRDPDLAPDELH